MKMHQRIREDLKNITAAARAQIGVMRSQPVTVGAESSGVCGTTPTMVGGASSARDIFGFLSSLGSMPCRVWGATPPGNADPRTGCPIGKKLCLMMFPMRHSVPAAATAEQYTIKAKIWYWPIMYVDGGTPTDVRLENLTYAGDPVWENGEGFGAITPANIFGSTGNYGFLPGLPAINDTTGLVHVLSNADAVNAEVFTGAYIGISIRN